MAGAWVGARLFLVASERVFRRVALVVIGAAGLFAIVR